LKEDSKEQDKAGQQKCRAYDSSAYPDNCCISALDGGIEKRHHVVFELMQFGGDYSFDHTSEQFRPVRV
jgi:hypothetical protein